MKHLFVSYELALKLKEKGFEEECFGAFVEEKSFFTSETTTVFIQSRYLKQTDTTILRPIYQQVIDWFLHEHCVFINIEYSMVVPYYRRHEFECEKVPMCYVYNIIKIGEFSEDCELIVSNLNEDRPQFKNYYDALNKAIEEALKLIL